MKVHRQFSVQKNDEKLRLDLFLAKYNNDLSRSYIKRCIESNNVFVNEKIEFRANYKVKSGEKINLHLIDADLNLNIEPEDISLNIIYEDKDLLAVDKPSGMSVQPGTGHKNKTLVNALLYRYKTLEKVGENYRTGLIHRLDKDTSGLILIAKTNLALRYYTGLFANREVKKQYLAIVYGKLPVEFKKNNKKTIQNFIGRNPKNRQKFSVLKGPNNYYLGKFAHTDVYYLKSINSYHLILASIKTGRTHQIRIHLASLGIPVLGDTKYGHQKYMRLMLHAWKMSLTLLNNGKKEFEASIPIEFKQIFPEINEILNKTKIK